MRTLEWDMERSELRMINQRLLPSRFEVETFRDHLAVASAIRDMVVRGAPAIGAAAAFGLALAACRSQAGSIDEMRLDIQRAADVLSVTRPTAVNLRWAIQRMLETANQSVDTVKGLRQNIVNEAQRIADEDVETNRLIAQQGAALIEDGDVIITHCNTGALAVVDWGTALGVIRLAFEQGKKIKVLVDETRPRLQGARLTAWELQQYGIPYQIISDGAAGYFLRSGQVQKAFYGADRVAANGDVANKVGSYMLALAAHANQVPVYSVFPCSTVDLTLENGDQIPIEERDEDEVLGIQYHGEPVAPQGAHARNPAFDVTPNHLLTGLVTEKGIAYPPYKKNLARLMA
jgi:methylthioribose-1-phosphate isomerase